MTPDEVPDEHLSCWLCDGLGGIAIHSLWSDRRGKPLWTAHKPGSRSHVVHPCPVCRLAVLANNLAWHTTCTNCAHLSASRRKAKG